MVSNVKITTSDISFIFTNYDCDINGGKELDLSECGDDIQIPTDFAEKISRLNNLCKLSSKRKLSGNRKYKSKKRIISIDKSDKLKFSLGLSLYFLKNFKKFL